MTGDLAMPEHPVPVATRRSRRGGFILMEVIVAMTLLALILTPLAAMVYKITARSHRTVGNSYRNAVVMQQVKYLQSIPYDSLDEGTTSVTVTDKPYPHTKVLSVDEYWTRWQLRAKRVQLVITPTNPLYRPDTTIFIRSSAHSTRALFDDGQP